jgi:hypothetical protein
MHMIDRIRARLAGENGFTLAMTMGIMMISSIVCIAAFQAARGDISPSADNSDRRVAYAAAESGIAWYASKLASNPDYWQKCDTGVSGGVPDPVNQPTVSDAARKWKRVPGTAPVGTGKADFSIAMMPIKTVSATCSTADETSMLNPADGSFKIRSTGRYHDQLRTIVTTFSRSRFLDFIYFTDYETLDPAAGNPGGAACGAYRASRPAGCTVIQFTNNDKVNGPLHTNDDLVYCGSPVFGRSGDDSIEVSGPAPGYAKNGGCTSSGTPTFKGTLRTGVRQLQMPPTNAALKTLVTTANPPAGVLPSTGGYLLSGTQYIRFTNDGKMVIDTPGSGGSANPVKVALPENGVIYVQNTPGFACDDVENPTSPYTYKANQYCANVYVSGTLDKSITLVSDKDIVVAPTTNYVGTDGTQQFDPKTTTRTDANLIAGTMSTDPVKGEQVSGPVQIGLIAEKFVRVYHRVSDDGSTNLSKVTDVRIDAAILSLQHSFIVDNYNRGTPTGNLTVHGAIAQRFRGPVGTSSGGAGVPATGYLKNYTYDNRLRFRSPPNFLDPVNAAWGVGRENELVPPV